VYPKFELTITVLSNPTGDASVALRMGRKIGTLPTSSGADELSISLYTHTLVRVGAGEDDRARVVEATDRAEGVVEVHRGMTRRADRARNRGLRPTVWTGTCVTTSTPATTAVRNVVSVTVWAIPFRSWRWAARRSAVTVAGIESLRAGLFRIFDEDFQVVDTVLDAG
jgi:hypothetical protein